MTTVHVPENRADAARLETLPVLPLRDTVVFPLAVAPLNVGQDRSVRLMDAVMKTEDRRLVLVRQHDGAPQPPGPQDCAKVGVVATVLRMRREEGGVQVLVQGLERVRIDAYVAEEPYLQAKVVPSPEPDDETVETSGLAQSVRELFQRLVAASDDLPEVLGQLVSQIQETRQTAYVVAAQVPMDSAKRQELLEADDLATKLRKIAESIQHELAVRDVSRRIAAETQETLTKAQREMYLREQLRSIRKELGEDDSDEAAVNDLRERLAKVNLPDEARKEVDRELARLERVPTASPEHGVIRTFIEWFADLPWGLTTGGEIDVEKARAVLDEDHHDLEDVKQRILETLAVRKLRRDRPVAADGEERNREPILCFVGPPGVGKTSLAQSIARALGRKLLQISLGGVHDESEIRGHRRTYVGAMPGRVVQALRRAEAADPVFVLDEVDKLSSGFHGDPAAALLELLDPAQNHAFTDTYLGVPFDLSKAMFICTANTTDTIPAPLLDRMERIHLSGYSEDDKVVIARRFVIPRQLRSAALRDDEVTFEDAALRTIIRQYTREAGVRSLERAVARICAKVALQVTQGGGPVVVTPEKLVELLGTPKSPIDAAERIDRPGVAMGLAWTPAGGEILFVEATATAAKTGRLVITGQLGEVMRESAHAALTWVRSRADLTGVEPRTLDEREVHVHVPGGAIPKDGPSAGVALAVALTSVLSGRICRHDVAMTGEITLRGKVLPVGGVKEKVLAAHRAGIRTIVLPRWNEQDLKDLADDVRRVLTVVPVDTIQEAVDAALEPGAPGAPGAPPAAPEAPVVETQVVAPPSESPESPAPPETPAA